MHLRTIERGLFLSIGISKDTCSCVQACALGSQHRPRFLLLSDTIINDLEHRFECRVEYIEHFKLLLNELDCCLRTHSLGFKRKLCDSETSLGNEDGKQGLLFQGQ